MQSILLLLLLTSTTFTSPVVKRGKKADLTKHDNDMAFLDAQILENDIRSYFDISTLNATLYLPTLEAAHAFAKGMYDGLEIESDDWLSTNANVQEYTEKVKGIRDNYSTLASSHIMEADMQVMNAVRKATSIKSTWHLLAIGLENLIRHQALHSSFFEYICNVFIEIDLVRVFEAINNHGIHKMQANIIRQMAKMHGGYNVLRQNADFKLGVPDNARVLLEVMDYLLSVIDIDVNAKDFDEKLEDAVEDSLKLLMSEMGLMGGTEIFETAAELLSKIQFWKLLRPLIIDNAPFVSKLNDLRYKLPSMHRLKSGDVTAALHKTLADFNDNMKQRYTMEVYFKFDTMFLGHNVYSQSSVTDAEWIMRDIRKVVDRHQIGLDNLLRGLSDPLFTPNSSEFHCVAEGFVNMPAVGVELPLVVVESMELLCDEWKYEVSSSLPHLAFISTNITHDSKISQPTHLKHSHQATLNSLLTSSTHSGLSSLKWTDCVKLILALGGSVRAVGGSIKMIHIPGHGFPTRFDQPHPSSRLGTSAIVLRKIFRKWGYQ